MIENARGALDGLSGEEIDELFFEERAFVRPSWELRTLGPVRGHREVFCACGTSILFGSAATDAERAEPMCSVCLATLAFLRRWRDRERGRLAGVPPDLMGWGYPRRRTSHHTFWRNP